MIEFNKYGMNEKDVITKETWFLKDLVNYYKESTTQTRGGTETPGNNENDDHVNLQVQIFMQLQVSTCNLKHIRKMVLLRLRSTLMNCLSY